MARNMECSGKSINQNTMKKLLLILFCMGLVGCAGNQRIMGVNDSIPIKQVGESAMESSGSQWWVYMIWFILIVGGLLLAWREFKPAQPEQTIDK